MTFQPGDILLDKYRIEELIGHGAFAEVYRATHIELNVPRSLKVLRKDAPGLGSTLFEDYEQRFKLEVQLGARINHPNVIQVHDVERHGDDLILVMEYAPGGSLAERLREYRDTGKTFETEETLQIAADVATGLGELHALDAVHRDLKPSNILFDAKRHAKIADLGLAQIPGGPSMRSQLSQPAPHPGTPGYMSPEQERTGHHYLRPSSDVYALGLVLFEMLSGRNYHHIEPGTQTGDLRDGLSDWIDELINLLLAEEPRDRPWDGKKAASLLDEGMRKLAAGQNEPEQLDKAQVEAERRFRRSPIWVRFKKRVSNVSRKAWVITGAIMLGMAITITAAWLMSSGTIQLAKLTPTNTLVVSTPTPTRTQSSTPSSTPSKTATLTMTDTPTVTPTITNTSTPSSTPLPEGYAIVPDVTGLELAEAQQLLSDAGFESHINYQENSAVPLGLVISQNQEVESLLKTTEKISLHISSKFVNVPGSTSFSHQTGVWFHYYHSFTLEAGKLYDVYAYNLSSNASLYKSELYFSNEQIDVRTGSAYYLFSPHESGTYRINVQLLKEDQNDSSAPTCSFAVRYIKLSE